MSGVRLDGAGDTSARRRSRRSFPHRDPFLLVDEVLELVPGERVVARHTVTDGGLRRALSRGTRSCPA